jgi:Phosphomannomutase
LHCGDERGADIGIAHDGDADRCLAIDANGQVVDGDQIMAILALAMRDSGALAQNTVVATVMSNLGFALAMEDAGIEVVRTSVGDRYVLEEMLAHGYTLGGEQSGHVVLSQWATTGDGVLTALMVLARMAGTGRSLADLASVMTRLPQVLVNVPGVDRAGLGDAEVMRVVADVEARLGDTGRVLLRSSGTEPLVRVMVEAPTLDEAGSAAEDIAAIVRDRLSLPS